MCGRFTKYPTWTEVHEAMSIIGPRRNLRARYNIAPTTADGAPVLALAGLWDRWKDSEGEELLSCSMIVTEPSDWMEPYHERLPVLLDREGIDAWLDGSAGTEILKPAEESPLKEWPVSKRVNKVGNDGDPSLIEEVA